MTKRKITEKKTESVGAICPNPSNGARRNAVRSIGALIKKARIGESILNKSANIRIARIANKKRNR